ncbi:MAG: YdcF family protein [Clostridia bacterium]|nr:YdcF family protein [Clostridia bacterium]
MSDTILLALLCLYLMVVTLWRMQGTVQKVQCVKAFLCKLGMIFLIGLFTWDLRLHVLDRLPFPAVARAMVWALCLGMAILCIQILRHLWETPDAAPDCLAVLGAALREGKPGGDLVKRVRGASVYAALHPGIRIFVSGGNRSQEISEAEVMRDLLREEGWKGPVILECQSRNTGENMRFLRKLIPADTPICIVTSDYHMARALWLAKRAGFRFATGLSVRSSVLLFPANLLWEMVGYVDEWTKKTRTKETVYPV